MYARVIPGDDFVTHCGDFMLVQSGGDVFMYIVCDCSRILMSPYDLPTVKTPLVLRRQIGLGYVTTMSGNLIQYVMRDGELPNHVVVALFFIMPYKKLNPIVDITARNVCDHL